jgi:tetratricopeptide (TPR) repeat protein
MALVNKTFVLHGFGVAKKKELSSLISDHGGIVAFALGRTVTHLVVTEEEARKIDNPKIKEASKLNIETIQEDSLQDYIDSYIPGSTPYSNVNSYNDNVEDSDLSQITVVNAVPSTIAPTVNMVLPESGPTTGEYKVALFGLNFVPGAKLKIKFGSFTIKHIEFHSASSVVCTVQVLNAPPGEVHVLASNDGGKHFGPSSVFSFTDPLVFPLKGLAQTEATANLFSQLENIHRSIQQLQHGLFNVESLEQQLYRHVSRVSTSPLPALLKPQTFFAHPPTPAQPVPAKATPTPSPSISFPPSSSSTFATTPKLASPQKSPSRPVLAKSKALARSTRTLRDKSDGEKEPLGDVTNTKKNEVEVYENPEKALLLDSEREVKIFISSPFKDMNAERDLLVKKIIPHLKRSCGERDVVLSYVDFRWGVTESQNEQAQTLLMCLREIQRCNIFIGLYGERYGWNMRSKALLQLSPEDELLKRSIEIASAEFPWVNQYKDKSVTEIEMRMVLNKKYSGPNKAAWFYLRDPYYSETVPVAERLVYISEGPEELEKLHGLKAEIEKSKYPSRIYNRPSSLEEFILEDVNEFIDRKHPKGSQLSPLDSERFRHSSYARAFRRVYQSKEHYFLQLDKHANTNTGIPLVVFGESGMGKSALLANWSNRFHQHHPESILITHFVGCSPASSNYGGLIQRIMRELLVQVRDGSTNVPNETQAAIEEFPKFLEDTLARNKRSQLVLIIDALDNLDDRENALDLLWLPATFPKNVCVVLSVAPGKVAEGLQRRKYPTLAINPLEEAERKALIRMLLDVNSKKLSAKQELQIAHYQQCGNPRFLRVLLDDITVWGQFEQLDTKIARDLKASTTSELYEILLDRLETDHGKDVVKHFFTFLGCSRRGLYLETELAPLLFKKKVEHKQWSSLAIVIEDLLLNSLGLLSFSNKDIVRAVKSRYMGDSKITVQYHKELADLFSSMEGYPERKIEEWCWQLEKAGEYRRLLECLTNLSVFDKLYTPMLKFDLFSYWRTLEQQLKIDVVAEHMQALQQRSQFPHGVIVGALFYRVANFMEEIGKYKGAEDVFLKARDHYENSAQNVMVAYCNYSVGRVLLAQARYDESEKMLKKALELYLREKGPKDVDVAQVLTRLGALYSELNRTDEAEEAFEKSLQIRIEKLGPTHTRVGQTLKHMLTMYEQQGNDEKALKVGLRALEITEARLGPDDPNVSSILVRLGRVYMRAKQYKQAKAYFKRALAIIVQKLGPEHHFAAENIYELGAFYFVKPEEIGKKNNNKGWAKDKAEEYFLKALAIKEKSLGPDHPDVARILNRLGSVYIERIQFNIAEQYLTRAYKIRKEKLGPYHGRVGQTLKHMMTLFQSQENVPRSIECGLEAVKVFEKIGGLSSQVTIGNILVLLSELYLQSEGHKSENARKCLNRALEIRLKLGPDHPDVLHIQTLIKNLNVPPPPPPPLRPLVPPRVEEIEEKEVPIIDSTRSQLLDDIRRRGGDQQQTIKQKLHKQLKMKKNALDSAGWWKQNYAYNIALPDPSNFQQLQQLQHQKMHYNK